MPGALRSRGRWRARATTSRREGQMTAGQEEDVFDVRGDVVLVTGAASGLGLAFAEALAERGARVTLPDADADVLAASTQALADRGCTRAPRSSTSRMPMRCRRPSTGSWRPRAAWTSCSPTPGS